MARKRNALAGLNLAVSNEDRGTKKTMSDRRRLSRYGMALVGWKEDDKTARGSRTRSFSATF